MRCECGNQLIKRVEDGGLLIRGNAPIMRITKGRLVIEQRCPQCRRATTYSPMTIRLSDEKKA